MTVIPVNCTDNDAVPFLHHSNKNFLLIFLVNLAAIFSTIFLKKYSQLQFVRHVNILPKK